MNNIIKFFPILLVSLLSELKLVAMAKDEAASIKAVALTAPEERPVSSLSARVELPTARTRVAARPHVTAPRGPLTPEEIAMAEVLQLIVAETNRLFADPE